MDVIGSQVTGDLTVVNDAQYNNVFAENVTVSENVMVRIFGIIKNDLIVKQGATVYLHGRYNGKIINEGGVIYVFHPNGSITSH